MKKTNRFYSVAISFFLVLSSSVFYTPEKAEAVPAQPGTKETIQPDGKKFKLRLRGDEFFSWNETENGYAVKKDMNDGFWKYALPAKDRIGFEVIKNGRVGAVDPQAFKMRKHTIPKRELIKNHIENQRKKQAIQELTKTSTIAQHMEQMESSGKTTISEPSQGIPVSGNVSVKNVVILAAFSDHWDSANSTVLASKGRTDTAEYDDLFNQTNYTTDNAVGSVRDYYNEVSYNKLTIESIIVGWVQLPYEESHYDTAPETMVSDAIAAADDVNGPDFDFSQADSDGDGWIDSLTVIHSGHGEEVSGNPSTLIWSHQGFLSSVVVKDSVSMYAYHTEPALRGSTTSTSIIRIGVIAHEMGHFYGLPDLYDYSNTTEGIGKWGLMAGGAWGGGDGKRPSHFCAWSKKMLGFVNATLINSGNSIQLPRVEDNAAIHMIQQGMADGEYFLLENRAAIGFDADLPEGILIWHIDSNSQNNDLSTWDHHVVRLEEANGGHTLETDSTASSAHTWRNGNGLPGGFTDTTGNAYTNAMMYQSTNFCQRYEDSAYYSYIRIKNFSDSAAIMTYDLQTLVPSISDQDVLTGDFTVNWVASSGATAYEIQEGTPTTVTSFFDGAEDEDLFNDNWHISGNAKRSNEGAQQSGTYSFDLSNLDADENVLSNIQSFTLKKSFKAKTNTTISFYTMAKLKSPNGYLKFQLSNDNGNTWQTVATILGYENAWTSKIYNYATIANAGISANDDCIARFIMNRNGRLVTNDYSYPRYGFAVDDFQISNTEMEAYDNWTTLSNTETNTSYNISGKANGIYAYRVRGYANGTWQTYSSSAEVSVQNQLPTVTTNPATNIGYGSATLNGTVNPNGYETNYYFEYGTTTSYGWTTATASAGSDTSDVAVSNALSLSAGSIYHYRIVGTYASGTANGCDQTFQTTSNAPSDTDAVHRFYSSTGGTHFFTISVAERDGIIGYYPENVWKYEGAAWYCYTPENAPPEASAVYRFYSSTQGAHFFTISETEKDFIIASYPDDVWHYEGIAWYCYTPENAPPETSAVYRFYSSTEGAHFFTISEAEKDFIIAAYPDEVWHYEGIAWYCYTGE